MVRVLSVAVVAALLAGAGAGVPHAVAAEGGLSDAAVLTVRGGGWGHGHGMGQYGAQGLAKAGATWKQILHHYYTGVTIADRGNGAIRVLLSARRRVVVGGPEAYTVRFGNGTLIRRRTDAHPYTRAVATSDGLVVAKGASSSGPWSRVASAAGGRVLFTADDGPAVPVWQGGRTEYFRGTVEANRRTATTMYGINDLPLDDYLYGVVPREMPASWHGQALRAQSVAARSYAMWKRKSAGGADAIYHICATTFCQAYRGYGVREPGEELLILEHPRSTDAVNATTGRAMVVSGEGPIFAEYHSTSGGATGQGSRSYLAPVDDPTDQLSPLHRWETTVTAGDITGRWPKIGRLRDFSYERNGFGPFGGRILTVDLVGTDATVTITGETLRSALGLRSTLLTIDLPEPVFPDAATHLGGNLLANGSFEAVESGAPSAWDALGASSVRADPAATDGEVGIRLDGDRDRAVRARQVISRSGRRGDRFVVSAWNRADGTRAKLGGIGVTITFKHKDGTARSRRLSFEPRSHAWTYGERVVTSEKRYRSITVTLALRKQTGETTFDRLRLERQDVLNAGFESGLDGWRLTKAGSKAGRVTGNVRDGLGALRMHGSTSKVAVARQGRVPVRASAGHVLRLAAWNRTQSSSANGGRVLARARLTYADGTRSSHVLRFPRAPHEWVYGESMITVRKKVSHANVVLRYARQTGAVWFDQIVLARAGVRSLSANPGFELGRPEPGLWTMHNAGGDGALVATSIAQHGQASLHLEGASSKNRYSRQELPLGGVLGDRFRLSGWNRTVGSDPDGGPVQIFARVIYLDGSMGTHRMTFDRAEHDWTHSALTFDAQGPYIGIDVYARFSKQSGDAFFDNIHLQRIA